MADVIVIQHERRGNSIKPTDDNVHTTNGKTRVQVNSDVQFTAVGVDAREIRFTDKSPFGQQMVVLYGPRIRVTTPFDPQNNRFVYKCFGFGLDGTPLTSEDGGGEVEIVRP